MNNTIIKNIAEIEHQPYELIRKGIETGSIAIMYRGNMGIAIGTGLRTKINVNLGTSSGHCVPEEEIQKAKIAELYGADTITDERSVLFLHFRSARTFSIPMISDNYFSRFQRSFNL
jgi:thiamine biosynthesis protein ThiC